MPDQRFQPSRHGYACLEFANTVDWHASDQPSDQLSDYIDLVEWSAKAGILEGSDARALLRESARRPRQAEVTFRRAIALREAIYRIFSAHASGQPATEQDLAIVNAAVADAMGRSRIVPTQDGFDWGWIRDGRHLDGMLWPIARSAAELLTSEDLARVGECEDDRGCGWLFLDRSRNHSRRWCDMGACGNRAKAKRHYRRLKSEDPG